MQPLLRHSVRIGLWILGFMAVIFGMMLLIF
jgi:hypothetical protein